MEKKNSIPADIEPYNVRSTIKKRLNQYELSGKYIKTWESIAAAQKAMSPKGISLYKASKGILKAAYGYQWRVAE